jgi:hypothetical protein
MPVSTRVYATTEPALSPDHGIVPGLAAPRWSLRSVARVLRRKEKL